MLLTTILLAAAAGQAGHPVPIRCVKPGAENVGTSRPARPRKLDEMPPAKQMLTVLREVDGCPRPVVLREGVGAPRR